MSQIILASQSPRRKELLEQIGLEFEICPAKGEEIITKTIPSEVVTELAAQKAADIFDTYLEKTSVQSASSQSPLLVIGADTIVAIDDKILGKPVDEADAKRMLKLLSGKTHQVYTGVAFYIYDYTTGKRTQKIFYEKTDVTFYPMTDHDIDVYITTKDPLDKAGAYGIQGPCAIHIKEIHGDYNNVVGLPLARIYQELKVL